MVGRTRNKIVLSQTDGKKTDRDDIDNVIFLGDTGRDTTSKLVGVGRDRRRSHLDVG